MNEWRPGEMQEVHIQFRQRFPHLQGLTVGEKRQMLRGELVAVKVEGLRKFVVMTKDDVKPGGKLARMNAETKAHNDKVRSERRAFAAEMLAAMFR